MHTAIATLPVTRRSLLPRCIACELHPILTMRPIPAAAMRKLDGADTPARMVGTLACNSWQIPSSVLELRHAASVADNWFHASRDGGPGRRGEYPVTRIPASDRTSLELKSFRRRNNLPFSLSAAEEKRMHPGCSRCCGLNTTGHRRGRAISVCRIYFVSSDGNCIEREC